MSEGDAVIGRGIISFSGFPRLDDGQTMFQTDLITEFLQRKSNEPAVFEFPVAGEAGGIKDDVIVGPLLSRKISSNSLKGIVYSVSPSLNSSCIASISLCISSLVNVIPLPDLSLPGCQFLMSNFGSAPFQLTKLISLV